MKLHTRYCLMLWSSIDCVIVIVPDWCWTENRREAPRIREPLDQVKKQCQVWRFIRIMRLFYKPISRSRLLPTCGEPRSYEPIFCVLRRFARLFRSNIYGHKAFLGGLMRYRDGKCSDALTQWSLLINISSVVHPLIAHRLRFLIPQFINKRYSALELRFKIVISAINRILTHLIPDLRAVY